MAAAGAPTSSGLFPEGYDESNRKELDMHVKKILLLMYTKYGSETTPTSPQTSTNFKLNNFRWFNKDSMKELYYWLTETEPEVKVAPKQQTISKRGTKSKDMQRLAEKTKQLTLGATQQHSQSATGTKPEDKNSLKLGAKYFCEHFYHVRKFKQWQLENAESTITGAKQNAESTIKGAKQEKPPDSVVIKCEHCPGAEAQCTVNTIVKQRKKGKKSKPVDQDLQEIFCVGAVAVLTFTNGKQVLHNAHNKNSTYCSFSKNSTTPTLEINHAEVTVLTDLKPLLLAAKQKMEKAKERGVIEMCIVLSYQPCHYSTEFGSSYIKGKQQQEDYKKEEGKEEKEAEEAEEGEAEEGEAEEGEAEEKKEEGIEQEEAEEQREEKVKEEGREGEEAEEGGGEEEGEGTKMKKDKNNVSCCEYIREYLSSFNKKDEYCSLKITLKLAYFHKLTFAKIGNKKFDALIDNAVVGMKMLIKTPNLTMSHMTEDDWINLWKIL